MKLNYNKLKSEIEKSGKSIKDFSIEMDRSTAWFYQAMQNDSLRVSDLIAICEKLNLPISEAFDVSSGNGRTHVSKATKREILAELLEVNKQILVELRKGSKV